MFRRWVFETKSSVVPPEHLIEEGKDPSSSHQTPELPGHAGKEISAAAVATVHAGDSMWSLSARLLGKGEDWQCESFFLTR